MKRGDLVVGVEYAHRVGKHGDPRRCIVLDAEPVYDSPRLPYFSWHPTAAAVDERLRTRPARRVHWRSQRVLVALEIAVYADGGSDRPLIGTRWWPYAARCAEIVSPWAAEIERRAEAARRAVLAEKAREIADAQRAEQHRLAEIERAKRQAAMRKEEAIRREQFEQRVEPALRELGFEPRLSGSQITLTLDEATRLSALLGRDVSAES